MENSDLQHTCVVNVFPGAAKVCSSWHVKYRKFKNSRTFFDSITTTSELLILCYFLDALTLKLLFAHMYLGEGTYELNLHYFYCNA